MTEQLFAAPTVKSERTCPSCHTQGASRARRRGYERLLSPLLSLKAYRCWNCNKRFLSR